MISNPRIETMIQRQTRKAYRRIHCESCGLRLTDEEYAVGSGQCTACQVKVWGGRAATKPSSGMSIVGAGDEFEPDEAAMEWKNWVLLGLLAAGGLAMLAAMVVGIWTIVELAVRA